MYEFINTCMFLLYIGSVEKVISWFVLFVVLKINKFTNYIKIKLDNSNLVEKYNFLLFSKPSCKSFRLWLAFLTQLTTFDRPPSTLWSSHLRRYTTALVQLPYTIAHLGVDRYECCLSMLILKPKRRHYCQAM